MSDKIIANDAFDNPTISSGKDDEDCVLSQIETLNELASMNSFEYHQRLIENTLPTFKGKNLSNLANTIARNHALVQNLTTESDLQTSEILELQCQNEAFQNRIGRLENCVSKLYSQNVRLKEKSKSDKSVARKLKEQMKLFDAARKIRKEQDEVERLLFHENILRDRRHSNFSDLDGLQDFDNRSIDSTPSVPSLVTDGPPTVRFNRQRILTWPHTNFDGLTDTTLHSGGDFVDGDDGNDDDSPIKAKKPAIVASQLGFFYFGHESQSQKGSSNHQNRSKIHEITIPAAKISKIDLEIEKCDFIEGQPQRTMMVIPPSHCDVKFGKLEKQDIVSYVPNGWKKSPSEFVTSKSQRCLSEDSGTSTTLSSQVSAEEESSSSSTKEEKTNHHSSPPTAKFDIMSFFKKSQNSEPNTKIENTSSEDKVKTHHTSDISPSSYNDSKSNVLEKSKKNEETQDSGVEITNNAKSNTSTQHTTEKFNIMLLFKKSEGSNSTKKEDKEDTK